ncbi:hypothetical protein BHM03_00054965 [Ensete ventricosum]|nr:hypothetical protein BHM03_00054965 [Ensete ventricosum]
MANLLLSCAPWPKDRYGECMPKSCNSNEQSPPRLTCSQVVHLGQETCYDGCMPESYTLTKQCPPRLTSFGVMHLSKKICFSEFMHLGRAKPTKAKPLSSHAHWPEDHPLWRTYARVMHLDRVKLTKVDLLPSRSPRLEDPL